MVQREGVFPFGGEDGTRTWDLTLATDIDLTYSSRHLQQVSGAAIEEPAGDPAPQSRGFLQT